MTRAITIAVFAILTASTVLAQSPPATAFEVASVKPNKSGSGDSSMHTTRAELIMENVSLKQWIEWAYNLKDYSLSGPDWLDSERFDVIAKPPSGTQLDWSKPDVYKPMLQSLLVERFQLAFHRESKMLPAYALIVDKKGAKIQPVEAGGPKGTTSGRGRLAGTKVSMADFADHLSSQVDRPVQDLTGLQGVFNYKLQWTEDRPVVPGDGGEHREPTESATGPSLFSALQEQLGLKLEGRKLPIQVLAIDRIERVPTEN